MSLRTLYFVLAFFCHELLVAAWYFQYVQGLEPCPLCMVQRWATGGLALAFLVGALGFERVWLRKTALTIGLLSSVLGVLAAGRQLWLQHLPADQVPACGASLDTMLKYFPLKEVILQLIQGSGECAKVDWSLLGLSMANWTLLVFIGLLVFCGQQLLVKSDRVSRF